MNVMGIYQIYLQLKDLLWGITSDHWFVCYNKASQLSLRYDIFECRHIAQLQVYK